MQTSSTTQLKIPLNTSFGERHCKVCSRTSYDASYTAVFASVVNMFYIWLTSNSHSMYITFAIFTVIFHYVHYELRLVWVVVFSML